MYLLDLENQPPSKKQKQTNLTSISGRGANAMEDVKENANADKTVKKQTLQIETVEQWKPTNMVQYDVEKWLSI